MDEAEGGEESEGGFQLGGAAGAGEVDEGWAVRVGGGGEYVCVALFDR